MLLLDLKLFFSATKSLEIFFSDSEPAFVHIQFASVLLKYFFLLGVFSLLHFLKQSTTFLRLYLNKLAKINSFLSSHNGTTTLPLKSYWTISAQLQAYLIFPVHTLLNRYRYGLSSALCSLLEILPQM